MKREYERGGEGGFGWVVGEKKRMGWDGVVDSYGDGEKGRKECASTGLKRRSHRARDVQSGLDMMAFQGQDLMAHLSPRHIHAPSDPFLPLSEGIHRIFPFICHPPHPPKSLVSRLMNLIDTSRGETQTRLLTIVKIRPLGYTATPERLVDYCSLFLAPADPTHPHPSRKV